MSLDEVTRLWAEHEDAGFPDRLRGEEIAGVDMVMLDADAAGGIQTWMGNKMRLDEPHRSYLARCLDDLERVLPLLEDAAERRYYGRLRSLVLMVLHSDSSSSRDT